MRLWSLHPRYLDQQGLCGLWREACMARNALEQGESHGYFQHPQLERFKHADAKGSALELMHRYLYHVWEEGRKRGYKFDRDVIGFTPPKWLIPVTNQQLDFEEGHLLDKLEERDSIEEHNNLTVGQRFLDLHPLFYMVNGPIAEWERGGNNE